MMSSRIEILRTLKLCRAKMTNIRQFKNNYSTIYTYYEQLLFAHINIRWYKPTVYYQFYTINHLPINY